MILKRTGLFEQPAVLLVLCGCLAIYGFFVLLPCAFGSRARLARNAEKIGTSNPHLARVFCLIALVLVLVAFVAVNFLYAEVPAVVRSGVVLFVVSGGLLAVRRARREVREADRMSTGQPQP